MKISILKEISDRLQQYANIVDNGGKLEEHPVLLAAEQSGNEHLMELVANALVSAQEILETAAQDVESYTKIAEEMSSEEVNELDLETVVALANEFDKSGDPVLERQAAVLDQVLSSFAQDRAKYRQESHDRAYVNPTKEHERDIKSKESVKLINKAVKQYRPLEAPLSTRYCPDHAGQSTVRVGEDTFQCPLDKKIYNYREGFETMKGNKVPGGSATEQTKALDDRSLEHMNFSTRQSILNQ